MAYIYQFSISFMATIGFGIFFGAPFNSIIPTGFSGAVSWIVYYFFSNNFGGPISATFIASFCVGIFGEGLAIRYKKPATVFITPGIVSMVPGAGMYYTMQHLVQNDFYNAASYGTQTFFVAAAIAIGIVTATVFSRSIKRFKKQNKLNNKL
jgi:uncharacterized membrane protein YjjB (DUF3815 family)